MEFGDPPVFEDDIALICLSSGTTGIPKLIPRTHNDYAYNSKAAIAVVGADQDSVLLLVLPIAHNLPLACPGIQGYLFQGGKVVLSAEWGPAIAKNPFLQFSVKGAKAGDKIAVTWKDNKGESRTDEATVT